MSNRHTPAVVAFLLICLCLPCQAADGPKEPIPDLTKGEELTRANTRWAGPIGVQLRYWRPRQGSQEQKWVRQLQVLQIEEGSPADGVLEVGDVILGADGTGAKQVSQFQGAHSTLIPIANAITEAEARKSAVLKLLVWRKGQTGTIPIQLEYLGRYSETAPYNCPKSNALLRKGIAHLAKAENVDKAGFGILCLLAANDPTNPDNEKHQALAKKWAHELEWGDNPWYSGPNLIALAEYYMATKDESIFPKLVAHAEKHAKGVSWFGTTGHRWAEPAPDGSSNGRIGGYGPISCSGTLGFLGLSLAREAGVKSEVVEKSFKAQKIFFSHYAFKGGLPYGEHPYGLTTGLGDYNGKCAMSALALSLEEGQEEQSKYFASKAALSSDGVRGYAHGGPFFGQVFHPLGADLLGAESANLQFREIQWHLDLKRRWDHSRIFDARSNPYEHFSYAATAMLFYALPLKQLVITGRDKNPALEFSDSELGELFAVQQFDPAQATIRELVSALPRFYGYYRGPVGDELAARVKAEPNASGWPGLIDGLLAMAADAGLNQYGRTGAFYTLMKIKENNREPVRSMKNTEIATTMASLLQDSDPYIRFAAVRVLQEIDSAVVRLHIDAIMEAIVAIERPTFPLKEGDPLQWSHAIMGQLLVNHALKESLDGVNRAELIPAIRSLLRTPSGRTRALTTKFLSKFNKKETLAVSDLLIDNIQTSPPADAMFGRGTGPNAQRALSNHLFEEALILSMAYHPKEALKDKIPQKYGKAVLDLRGRREFMQHMGELQLVLGVDVQELVEDLMDGEASESLPSLKHIHSVKAVEPVLKLPANRTQLHVDATNFGDRTRDGTTYTWRKVFGPGKVGFTPNGTASSKSTTISFDDNKPGKYRLEVEMTDTLGLTAMRETVTVDLYDANGKVPVNRPPYAQSQELEAIPGQPVRVKLTGVDPDGDDLSYVVSKLPSHGSLTRADGSPLEAMAALDGVLDYTANYANSGRDQLDFLAMDGEGEAAEGTVRFDLSDKGVGVAVYESFNYPEGPIHGLDGRGSFGFAKPWEVTEADQRYKVLLSPLEGSTSGASISYRDLPFSGGRLIGQHHRTASRALDRRVLDELQLLDHGGELWFSLFMEVPEVSFDLMGPEVRVGFSTSSRRSMIFATLNGEKAGDDRNLWGGSDKLRFTSSVPDMIIGRCRWGKTATGPDLVEIFRVYDAPVSGPILIENPVAVLREVIDQQSIDQVRIHLRSEGGVDELRIGPTLNSVMIGTKPLR